MTRNKSDIIDKTATVDGESTSGEVVLRDESDEIIDNLKRQLSSLQGQLDVYHAGAEFPGGRAVAAGDALSSSWEAGITPHLSTRLQVPAEELTARLDRLIEKIDDSELRQELEHCRDLAFFLFETFQKISANHNLLTESLVAPKSEVEMAQFCRLLEHVLPALGTPIPVHKAADVPRRLVFSTKSATMVVKTLAELAHAFSGMSPRLDISKASPESGAGKAQPFLNIAVFSESPWAESEDAQEVTAFAMQRGITAGTIVDLLYVEKVIELQGGTFAFQRVEGKVHGFSVQLPYDEVDDN